VILFSTESINGDGYISFKLTLLNKRFMFGLSRASDAPSTTYGSTLSVRFTNALLSLSLLGVNSPPVVVAGITVVSIISSGLFSKSI
jgi:hypothetical protein